MNKSEAPKGYEAIKCPPNSPGCELCAFNELNTIYCKIELAENGVLGMCSGEYREDGIDVYFTRKALKNTPAETVYK